MLAHLDASRCQREKVDVPIGLSESLLGTMVSTTLEN